MTWKKVTNADPGDADHFGGNDTDKISDLFSGIDVDDVDINADWKFRDDKLSISNPTNTFKYTFSTSGIAADRVISLPTLTSNQTFLFEGYPQTVTNKTMDLEDNTLKLRDFMRVFKDGSTYYAVNSAGTIVSSGSVPETVLQAAIDGASTIYISPAEYNFSGSFAGINITSSKYIYMSPETVLRVPEGYASHLFKFEGSIAGASICGGHLGEQGTAQKLWKGIHLKSTGSGAASKHLKFDYIQIDSCGWMVYLEVTNSVGFINSLEFNNIWGYYPIVGFEWVNSGGGADPFLHNHYYNIDIQADANTLYGFKNVMTRSPVFVGCEVQDMDSTDTQMLIHSSCADAIIIGGSLNSGGSTGLFTDNGSNTWILARGSPFVAARGLTLPDADNIVVGTTTGTKIGTSTTQKIGFFNKTPIAQKAANPDTSGAAVGALEVEVNELKQLLRDYGLMA